MVPGNVVNSDPTRAGALFARIQDVRLQGHGKVDLSKAGSQMGVLSCTSSYQTSAKYLRIDKKIPVAIRL